MFADIRRRPVVPDGRFRTARRSLHRHSLLPWCCFLFLATAGASAHADPGELGEVVVTATLRPTAALDVPGSVTVLERSALHGAGQQHFEDVIAEVPNLNWAGDTARPRYFQIRGIGELAQYQGAPNPSIGFLIDDIDFSGIGTAATLFDVNHVEVLRGPQGARYGANALGGLIYLSSAAPSTEFGGRVELGVGDYNTRRYGAVLTGPVPSLDSSLRLAVQRFTSDGYYSNAYLSRNDTARMDELTLRGRWRIEPSDRLRIDFTVMHTQIDDGYDDFSINNQRTTYSDQPGEDSQHSTGVAAHVEYRTPADWLLTAIASYADSPIRYTYDGDWGNAAFWAPYIFQSNEAQYRHRTTRNFEMRLGGDSRPGTSWVVGAYALDLHEGLEDTIYNLYQDPTSGYLPPASTTQTTSSYAARSTALFGELDQVLAKDLRLSIGLRTERRSVTYQDQLTSTGELPLTRAFAPTDSLWGGNVSLAWKPAPTRTVYALVSRGYKAGGFNLSPGLPTDELRFRPETDLNFEIGYKADLPAQRLRIDTALFYARREALQLLTGTQLQADDPSTFVFFTGNAPGGFNRGLEASVTWQPTATLEAGTTLGLLQTRYHGLVQNGVTLPDRAVPHAPSWQSSVHIAWTDPRGTFARVDLSGMGSFYFDLPPNPTVSRPYWLLGARAGYETTRWSAALWARNLLDKQYAVRGFYFGDEPPDFANKEYVQLGPPRTFGIDLTLLF